MGLIPNVKIDLSNWTITKIKPEHTREAGNNKTLLHIV